MSALNSHKSPHDDDEGEDVNTGDHQEEEEGQEEGQEEEEEEEDRKPAAKPSSSSHTPSPGRKRKRRRSSGGEDAAATASKSSSKGSTTPVVTLQEKWDEMYDRLVKFKEKYGHCLVPNRYREDPSLGSWVATQRRTYKILTSGGSASSGMNVDRARRLMDLGFEWETTDPRHVPWEERYEELKAFVTANGHAEVPMRWEENVQLSHWVSKQRQDYKLLKLGKTTRLTEKRRKLLNDIGFVWEIPRKGRRLRSAKAVQRAKPVASSTSATNTGNHATDRFTASPDQPQTGPIQQQQQQQQQHQAPDNQAFQAALAAALGGAQVAMPAQANSSHTWPSVNLPPNVLESLGVALSGGMQQGVNQGNQNAFNLAQMLLGTQAVQQPQVQSISSLAPLLAAAQQGQAGSGGPNLLLNIIQALSASQQQQQLQQQPQAATAIPLSSLAALLGGQNQGLQQIFQQSAIPQVSSTNTSNLSQSQNTGTTTSSNQLNNQNYALLSTQQQIQSHLTNQNSQNASNISGMIPQQQLIQLGGVLGGNAGGGYQPTLILLPLNLAQTNMHQSATSPSSAVQPGPQAQNHHQGLPSQFQGQSIQGYAQAQQSQTAAPAGLVGALDWNALSGMGISNQLQASFGINPSSSSTNNRQPVQQNQPDSQRPTNNEGSGNNGNSEEKDQGGYTAV